MVLSQGLKGSVLLESENNRVDKVTKDKPVLESQHNPFVWAITKPGLCGSANLKYETTYTLFVK